MFSVHRGGEAECSGFTGADEATAHTAYTDAVGATIRFQASVEKLEDSLDQCSGFAVGQAYAAVLASVRGESERAERRARLARRTQRGATRRERQLVEILLLSVDGDRRRAEGLTAEHLQEFADDRTTLTAIGHLLGVRRVLPSANEGGECIAAEH